MYSSFQLLVMGAICIAVIVGIIVYATYVGVKLSRKKKKEKDNVGTSANEGEVGDL